MRTSTTTTKLKQPVKDKYPSTCPRQITPAIEDFAEEIAGHTALHYVPVRPLPICVPRMCYRNAFMARDLLGGEAVFGFSVWTTRDLFLTAEHHCVVRKPDGELIDVTPDWGGANQVLFVPTGQDATPENAKNIALNGVNGHFRVVKDHPLLHRAVAILKEVSTEQHRDANRVMVDGRRSPAAQVKRWCDTVSLVEQLIDRYYHQQRKRGEDRQRRRKKKAVRMARKRARAAR